MANELGHQEALLGSQPQQPSAYTFAPHQFAVQQHPQREVKKNFVFVDEHNRHKRLKVMRACEGCRKRKIKCDAATTNTWPCSACIRLKLTCVRPNGYDDNGATLYEPSSADAMSPVVMQVGFQQQQQQQQQPQNHQQQHLPQQQQQQHHHNHHLQQQQQHLPQQQQHHQQQNHIPQSHPSHPLSHPHMAMPPSQPLAMPNAGTNMFHTPQGFMGSFQVSMFPDSFSDSPQAHQMHYDLQNMAIPSPVSALDQHHFVPTFSQPPMPRVQQPITTPPITSTHITTPPITSTHITTTPPITSTHITTTPPITSTPPTTSIPTPRAVPAQQLQSQRPSSSQTTHDTAASPGSQSQDTSTDQLTDILGLLNVDEKGSAPYLQNKNSFRHQGSAVESQHDDDDEGDDEEDYQPPPVSRGSRIRIPPDLMPPDDVAEHYFDLFFTQVHPYIPVLSRTLFYRQWHNDRASMSHLVLEAIFAIGGRIADEPAQGQRWLSLASRHADAFMDTPRISTLQALLLILKAREAAPKRGYYYRSWMTVVQCVQMGKDLGLDEHLSDHKAGISCGSSTLECQMKTRIWQAIFACETMTGAPQGRMEMAVDRDTVQFDAETDDSEYDDDDVIIGRNYAYFIRVIRNISKMSHVYTKVKKQATWGLDPTFLNLNHDFDRWIEDLPKDLSVDFPPDGVSLPILPSTFHGNMLSYYYLTLILVHRPQIAFLEGPEHQDQWKRHMLVCNRSAKLICRLQEAIIKQFGLLGLQAMLRGHSFSVYAGLSCIVLHLASMTSPDPEINTDASEYFARHMRVIEQVMKAWPMPELKRQVDSLITAFSADPSRPFTLKSTHPYNSPRPSHDSVSPPPQQTLSLQRPPAIMDHMTMAAPGGYSIRPMTPPVSAGPLDSTDSPTIESLVMMPNPMNVTSAAMPATISHDLPNWNPGSIFSAWDSAFTQQQSSAASAFSPSTTHSSPQTVHHDLTPGLSSAGGTPMSAAPSLPHQQHQQHQQHQHQHQQMAQQFVGGPSYLTPEMWQQSIGTIYMAGTKRTFADYSRVKEE